MKYLIVGLGNIGSEYEQTRHNIGFMVLDKMVSSTEKIWTHGRYAYQCEVRFKGRIITLIKPTTYMNLSGKAVHYWMKQLDVPIENILVISDDLDLSFGTLRLKPKGSGGSHNGLNHIIETLGNNDFPRLRFGIGSSFFKGRQVEYVLGNFNEEEKQALPDRIDIAVKIIQSFTTAGIGNTMTSYNNK
ncbi:MAG: aminoacyl-tRNA hydrolase [Bacteroidota bacterium]